MKRRTIAALLACTMVIGTLAGCSSEPKNPGDSDTTAAETTAAAQTGPKVFNDYMTTDIDTLNSHIYTLSASSDVINPTTLLLYRQYPTADGKSFEYIPELAESEPEQVDADGKIWQIKIRENAKWENGDSINVDDVIYSFQMCLDPLMVITVHPSLQVIILRSQRLQIIIFRGQKTKSPGTKWESREMAIICLASS